MIPSSVRNAVIEAIDNALQNGHAVGANEEEVEQLAGNLPEVDAWLSGDWSAQLASPHDTTPEQRLNALVELLAQQVPIIMRRRSNIDDSRCTYEVGPLDKPELRSLCGLPALHKVEVSYPAPSPGIVPFSSPVYPMLPFSAYLCCEHFSRTMGRGVECHPQFGAPALGTPPRYGGHCLNAPAEGARPEPGFFEVLCDSCSLTWGLAYSDATGIKLSHGWSLSGDLAECPSCSMR